MDISGKITILPLGYVSTSSKTSLLHNYQWWIEATLPPFTMIECVGKITDISRLLIFFLGLF